MYKDFSACCIITGCSLVTASMLQQIRTCSCPYWQGCGSWCFSILSVVQSSSSRMGLISSSFSCFLLALVGSQLVAATAAIALTCSMSATLFGMFITEGHRHCRQWIQQPVCPSKFLQLMSQVNAANCFVRNLKRAVVCETIIPHCQLKMFHDMHCQHFLQTERKGQDRITIYYYILWHEVLGVQLQAASVDST